jgi:hypothetical protein
VAETEVIDEETEEKAIVKTREVAVWEGKTVVTLMIVKTSQ